MKNAAKIALAPHVVAEAACSYAVKDCPYGQPPSASEWGLFHLLCFSGHQYCFKA